MENKNVVTVGTSKGFGGVGTSKGFGVQVHVEPVKVCKEATNQMLVDTVNSLQTERAKLIDKINENADKLDETRLKLNQTLNNNSHLNAQIHELKHIRYNLEAKVSLLESELEKLKAAIKEKGGNEHQPTEWAYSQACKSLWSKKSQVDALVTLFDFFKGHLSEEKQVDFEKVVKLIVNARNA